MLTAAAMRRLLLLATLPALGACATSGDRYPSLAIRDVERAQGQFDPIASPSLAVPEVALPGGGSLAERLSALGAVADAAHRAFLAAAPAAARRANAAAGAAIGSDSWATAQVALADLDSARSMTAIPLADLDTLMVANAVQARDVSAIEAVRQQVLTQVREQDEVLARLRAQVR